MENEIAKKINDIKFLLLQKDDYVLKLNEVNKEYEKCKRKKLEANTILNKENVNTKKLETMSIVSLWIEFMNSDENELVNKAKHNYLITFNTENNLYSEMQFYKNKIAEIDKYQDEYDELFNQLGDSLNKNQEKENIDNEFLLYKNQLKQIKEAIKAGANLKYSINYLFDILQKAKKWGAFDIVGKGLLANVAKNSFLKEAEQKLDNIHYLINKFIRELKHVDFVSEINLNIVNILTLENYIFDGLYSDLSNISNLKNTINIINDGYKMLIDFLNTLNEHKITILDHLKYLNTKKNEIS